MTQIDDAHFRDATAIVTLIRRGQIRCVEVLDLALARYDAINPRLNAVIAARIEEARAKAQKADADLAKGAPPQALFGLPMTVKDGFDVEGLPATSGDKIWARRNPACKDAEAVALLRQAGANLWGKTNVPKRLADLQTYNEIYGATRNPWALDRTCGGSSGGAAVAVAAGISALELGSDLGGSLRIPAAFCGIYSLRPTWGAISMVGCVPPEPGIEAEFDMWTAGPMARSARDLRLAFGVLAGSTQRGTAQRRPDLRGKRIGLWVEEPGFPLAQAIGQRLIDAGSALAQAGAVVDLAPPPGRGDELVDVFLWLLLAQTGADFTDAQRKALNWLRPWFAHQAKNAVHPHTKAGYALRVLASHRDWLKADIRRQAIRQAMARHFDQWDALLCPAAPVTAFPHQTDKDFIEREIAVDGKAQPYGVLFNWIALASACGLPVVTLPMGFDAGGLPIGAQLIGKPGSEEDLIDLAEAMEEVTGRFMPPPI